MVSSYALILYNSRMAKLIRSAKPGSRWTPDDLASYRIRIVDATTLEFFGVAQLPATTVPHEILHNLEGAGPNSSEIVQRFFKLLGRIPTGRHAPSVPETLIDDFSAYILDYLVFPPYIDMGIRRNFRRDFVMSGQRVWGTPDLEIQDAKSKRILIVQENKVSVSALFPQLQIDAVTPASPFIINFPQNLS